MPPNIFGLLYSGRLFYVRGVGFASHLEKGLCIIMTDISFIAMVALAVATAVAVAKIGAQAGAGALHLQRSA